VVTDGSVGMENQCVGLARMMGLEPVVKRIAPRAPWRWLPPGLWPVPFAALGKNGDDLAPPWPRVLISVGRRSVALSMAVRRAAKGATFTVQLQNPKVALSNFDVVVLPQHDAVSGANVIVTMGAMHGITPGTLKAAAERFRSRLSHLPRPLVAVLIGGTSGAYRVGRAEIAQLTEALRRLAGETGAGFAVTPSRRTGDEAKAALRDGMAGLPAEIWNGAGENPYLGYLALCDAVIVTCDSVNMVTESCATGKPVHVVELKGGNARFRRFHEAFVRAGYTRPFVGRIESWTYPPLFETARVAAEIRRRLGWSGEEALQSAQGN
jgi:uncharacterized protein